MRILIVLGRLARVLVVGVVLTAIEVGVPAMLVRFAGWPLPRQVPSWADAQQALLSPIPDDALLKVLACPLWLLWAAFTFALLVEIVASIRGVEIHVPLLGPLQTLAAGLIGSLAVAVLPIDSHALSAPIEPHTASVASTAYEPVRPAGEQAPIWISSEKIVSKSATPEDGDRFHVVERGDSLWTIARHRLGSSLKWRKLWQLNAHHRQADGQTFTDPGQIHPGWQLRLPDEHPRPPLAKPPTFEVADLARPPASEPRVLHPTVSPTVAPSSTAEPTSEAVEPSTSSEAPEALRDLAASAPCDVVELPSGGVVAMSVAAGVCAAYASARFKRRRRRVPPPASEGVTISPEPALAPVVGAMRRAYFQSFRQRGEQPPSDAELMREAASIEIPDSIVIGTREDGSGIGVPLAGLSLGLAGPGCHDVARAFVLALLQQAGNIRAEIILSADDATDLTGIADDELDALARAVPGLTVTESLSDSISRLQGIGFTRLRILAEREAHDIDELRRCDPADLLPAVILIASDAEDLSTRLDATLQSGATCGIGALLLGDWPPGTTCHVDSEHRVSSATGPFEVRLGGANLFHLPAHVLADALRQIAEAQDEEVEEPQPPDEPPRDWEHSTLIWCRVLGRPAVWVQGDDRPLRIRGLKLWLLVYLALHPEGATKEAICEALWPGKPPGHEFHSLLRHLRDALEGPTRLTGELFVQAMSDETYRVDPRTIGFDLWDFRAAVKDARNARADDVRRAALERAAHRCGGELGEGGSEEWLLEERYPLTLAQVDALTQLAELCELQEPERALEALERARELDPDVEETWCRIIRLHVRLGNRDQARHTGRLLRTHLRGLGAEPMPDTNELLASLNQTPSRRPKER